MTESIDLKSSPARGAPLAAGEFFRSKLGDVEDPTAPFGLIDFRSDGSQIRQAQRTVEEPLVRRARAAARELGVNAATLFHVVWALVVARCCGRDDVVFGTVLSPMQAADGAQRASGALLNTLPLRLKLAGVSAKQLAKRAHADIMELLDYAQASPDLVRRSSAVGGNTDLFSAVLNYRTTTSHPVKAEASGVNSAIRLADGGRRTDHACSLFVDDSAEGSSTTVQTAQSVDPNRVLSYVHTALESVVQALEGSPERAVLELAVLPPDERRQLVEEFNATQAEYANEALIHELIEEQVRKAPQAIAVAYEDEQLTYQQLDERANRLANYLRERDVGPEQRVGICVERSLEMMVGLLGILKAGGAYLPLDPSYPREQLDYILKDAAPKVLLTLRKLKKRLPETAAEVIAMDADWPKIAERPAIDVGARKRGLRSDNLAYVIYTSGSTGQPKGVLVEHGSVINLWGSLERLYGQAALCQHVALNASINFDASVKQLVQLLSGRSLSIVPQETRLDVKKLLSFIEERQIDAIDCTPSQLKLWVDAGMLERKHPHMVLVGGEAIDPELWRRLGQCTEKRFFNVYGPTECTVDATACRLEPGSEPSIGGPLNNTQIYILDARGEPAPIGVTGEIYISGVGVARGYLNRAALTAERFLKDPFSADATARMYRTGDMGKWRADGTVEYVGRNDNQVKIRGFRIELGEIEAQLAAHPDVRAVAVMAREDVPGQKRLAAYIVPRVAQFSPSVEELRTHLKDLLPEHMVPSAFVQLDRLPLTPSGKLDRRALPAPQVDAYVDGEYEAPQGEMEERIARLWQDLLEVERVGRHDDFFDLGGHSIVAIAVVTRVAEQTATEVSVGSIFRYPTVASYAQYIESLGPAQYPALDSGGMEFEERVI